MKYYILNSKCLFLTIFIIALTSCDDLLDTTPKDFYVEESYWKTSNQALDAITGCYRALNESDMYGEYVMDMYECMTPNAYHKDNYHSAHDFAIGEHTGTTLGIN